MFDVSTLQTPCYVIDEAKLEKNCLILADVQKRSGAKILLAQKAYSIFHTYPLLSSFLSGTTASGLFEARLGYEEFGKEVHVYAPAFKDEDMKELVHMADHIVFNSMNQFEKHIELIKKSKRKIEVGLRINPEYSEIEVDLYNPCIENSRFGILLQDLPNDLSMIDGLHFHTLCEQGAETLERTLKVVEEKFARYLSSMKWINFGGGHHITKEGYNIELLIQCIIDFKEKYNVEVYLEPGEAVALNAGYLVSEVLDTFTHGMNIGILDASAACHMPDVLEMPYRPNIMGSGLPYEKEYTYRFGGNTCLAGDVIGDYSFDQPLRPKDRVIFLDMAIYSIVKNNTFNGIGLPSLYYYKKDQRLELIKSFTYQDFKMRLS